MSVERLALELSNLLEIIEFHFFSVLKNVTSGLYNRVALFISPIDFVVNRNRKAFVKMIFRYFSNTTIENDNETQKNII